MKKLFTIIALAVGMILPMQAQNAYIYKTDGTTQKVPAEKMYFNTIGGSEYLTTEDEVDLNSIVGDYTVYGLSAFGGEEVWDMTITQDEKDANKVWIQPICYWDGITAAYRDMINPVYATYDKVNAKLIIPSGQTLLVDGNYRFVLGFTTYDDENFTPNTTDDIVASVVSEGMKRTISIQNIYLGVGDVNDPEGEGWWYQALYDIYMLTDLSNKIIPVEEISQVSTTMPEVNTGILEDGNYTWSFAFTEDGTNWSNQSTNTTFTGGDVIELSEVYGSPAAGVWAKTWNVSGFFKDAGLFDGGGESRSFKGFSYTTNGSDFLDFVETEDEFGYCCIGKAIFTDEQGQNVSTNMYLGDLDGNQLYSELFFYASGDVYIYEYMQICIWYEFDGQAYLFGSLKDIEIARAGASAAPQMVRGKIELAENAKKLGASQKLEKKGKRNTRSL